MMRGLFAIGIAAGLFAASAAVAKPYVDYTPEKGVWQITGIEGDPSHIDDYLTGLRRSQVPGLDIMKKRGMIDEYHYVVRNGYSKGAPNVLIKVHYVSMAMLAPDKARDESIEKEIYATFSEEAGKQAVAGYEKFRQFVDDGYWSEVAFAK